MHIHQDRPASSGQWLRRHDLLNFITTLYEGDLHAKRVLSLANATVGVLTSASLAIHAVGRGLAQAMGTLTKHGVKQVQQLQQPIGLVCAVMPRALSSQARRQIPVRRVSAGLDHLDGSRPSRTSTATRSCRTGRRKRSARRSLRRTRRDGRPAGRVDRRMQKGTSR